MLVEFSVTNYLSIREKVTLSLVKGPGAELEATNVIKCGAPSTPDLLASAAIYGANGAGKSNVFRALQTMRNIVRNSASHGSAKRPLPITPFMLDDTSNGQPSEFDLTFIVEEVRYQYGFSATSERVEEEWLYAYPKGRPRQLIERRFDAESRVYSWGAMDKLVGQKHVWQEATRENGLFLSTAVNLNCGQLQPLMDWFRERLVFNWWREESAHISTGMCSDAASKRKVESILQVADTGIAGVRIKEIPSVPRSHNTNVPDWVADALFEEYLADTPPDVKTIHVTDSGRNVEFDLDHESEGTQKLFYIAGVWLHALENGGVLVVDEFDNSLHPHMVRFLVGLFHDKEVNRAGAQLLFNTHDTSQLSQDFMRRDQIWLCEKKKDSSTDLYSVVEFSPRKGVENLERGYLGGRYGALPIIGDLASKLGG